METNTTPFWLELRKEYIDDNFDKLQVYLQKMSTGAKDSFYETTLHLLRQRIENLLSVISTHPLYDEKVQKHDEMLFDIRLLATYLLVDRHHPLALTAYTAFMYKLSQLNPRFSTPIIKNLMQRLTHEFITDLGYGWGDLEKIGTDIFVHNLCTYARFDTPLNKPLFFEHFGTACLSRNGLNLIPENLQNSRKLLNGGAESLDTGIGVSLKTTSAEKLKQSLCKDIDGMDEFVKNFVLQQWKVRKKETVRILKPYYEEQKVLVKVTQVDLDGTIHVETVDPGYNRIAGTIRFKSQSLVYYYTSTLYKCIHVGDCLRATLTSVSDGLFSIEEELVDFFVNSMQEAIDDDPDNLFLGKLLVDNPSYYVWLTDWGVAVYTKNTGDFVKGDFADLIVSKIGTDRYHGKIDGYVVRASADSFDEQSIRHDCIRLFAEEHQAPNVEVQKEQTDKLSPVLLRILLRLFFEYQKSLMKPSERYIFLGNARVMAELVDDKSAASYIDFVSTYLRVLVLFVTNGDFNQIRLYPDEEYRNSVPALIRFSVLELLREYGRKTYSEVLDRAVKDFEIRMPMLSNLARLIQTYNSMQDVLSKAALNVIRREIIKTLSLETENSADLEADTSSTYLGVESGTQEFKTSMVYPPDNQMQPDEYAQNNNVMRGICAFLNSATGGTLYLGVNDLGYVTGLDEDFKYLKTETIDSYMRYVQDLAKKYFGTDTLPYLRIEPQYNQTVVAIYVEPHPYRVVELNGTAYIRVNAESREMPEKMRLELIARKVFKDKNRAAAVSQLLHAQTTRKTVILHNYASSHTGQVADRRVEAYDILPDDNLIICYDCDKHDVRVFNINRIGYIEILDAVPWRYAASHRKIEVDVFHMSGDRPISVSLQLDLLARNLLVEEYPRAKDFLTAHKGNENIWYFHTDVYQIEGVARFYLGLANHIQILDAPALKQYVQAYSRKYLTV